MDEQRNGDQGAQSGGGKVGPKGDTEGVLSGRKRERLSELLDQYQVFGSPVRQGNTTLVPVASVRAGAGRHASGRRKGRGIVARPVGAFSITDGGVSWQPAVNVNRIVWGGQLALATVLVSFAITCRRRRRFR